jgi:L-seryl-tRNA(Ser) seleniumtransferase
MVVLQARASEIISEITGSEAAIVTSGAAAGLLLGTAACITGLDPGKMNRLPDTSGMRNEVIVARSQRYFYDHAIRAAGAKLIEVGIADRFSGAGVRDAEPWEFADAINEQTAAVLYLAQPHSQPSLTEVVAVARKAKVPVIVDAAGQLPPIENLRRFIDDGADLVAFSGGKAIRGPQSSGILCGRRDLIASAVLQWMDTDIYFEQWNPPSSFIDKSRLKGLPQHGIGRSCKVGKEEVVGLLTALKIFAEENPEDRFQTWASTTRSLYDALQSIPYIEAVIQPDSYRPGMPGVQLKLDESAAGLTALQLVQALQDGVPSIHVDNSRIRQSLIGFAPICLKAGEPAIIARRLREVLVRK